MNETLERLRRAEDLPSTEAESLCLWLARAEEDGGPSDAQAAAVLTALKSKGETAAEVAGFARAMRRQARRPRIDPASAPLVDIVGTGGDGSGSMNLSTGAALLAAACGIPVAKHGNRAVSGRCGSADLIEALGLRLPLDEQEAGECLAATGFTFLHAPHYHPATARLAAVRRSLGVPTIFNLLGPLTNPAHPPFAVIGAASEDAAMLLAGAIAQLGVSLVLVVHGAEGWDEPTPVGEFLLLEVSPAGTTRRTVEPEVYGLRRCSPDQLRGGTAAENAAALRGVFDGQPGPHRDAIILGASLALEVTGRAESPLIAADLAAKAIDTGLARRVLDNLTTFEQGRARREISPASAAKSHLPEQRRA